ncbi:MAG: glycosyltransferase [Polyangiaceae bacterium]|nr:glycosyltransferase [Polyangiaceae bacterium]
MRVLVLTRIFPNRAEPTFGPYNLKQLAALRDLGWSVRVVNPIPWFPGASRFSGKTRAASLSAVPRQDSFLDLEVDHPRFLHIPRLLAAHAPIYAASVAPTVAALRGSYDVILSPFAYPDGVASLLLGQALGLPVVIKLHGGDMNVGAKLPGPGRWIRWAFPKAARIVAVSDPLADAAVACGAPRSRVDVVQDGVDDKVFFIRDAREVRRALGRDPDRKLLVFVGRLEKRKGVYELLEAFERLAPRHPDVDLVLVGDGDDTKACRERAEKLGGRVILTGNVGMEGVADWLAASTLLTLPSYAEGTPNVVIEAIASGRPVVASRVGGIPDMITSPKMGELHAPEDVAALETALEAALARSFDPDESVRLSGRGTWRDSAGVLAQSLRAAVEAS